MRHHNTPYGTGFTLALPFDEAVRRTRDALAAAGFTVVAEIDMAATLRRRLGHELRPYVILGACDADLAADALDVEPDVGLLLPWNVVVYAADEPWRSVVTAIDAEAVLGLTREPGLESIADEVGARLRRAIAGLAVRVPETETTCVPDFEVPQEIVRWEVVGHVGIGTRGDRAAPHHIWEMQP
jgi:uncharacterized protein (DUF302 family)